MSSMNFNEFLETLTEEQRTAVLACRTEEELEQVIDDYDIDIPDEMLVSVAGGKGFIPIALAAIMMFTSAAPLVAGAAEAPAYVDVQESDSGSTEAEPAAEVAAETETEAPAKNTEETTEEVTEEVTEETTEEVTEEVTEETTTEADPDETVNVLHETFDRETAPTEIVEVVDAAEQTMEAYKNAMGSTDPVEIPSLGSQIVQNAANRYRNTPLFSNDAFSVAAKDANPVLMSDGFISLDSSIFMGNAVSYAADSSDLEDFGKKVGIDAGDAALDAIGQAFPGANILVSPFKTLFHNGVDGEDPMAMMNNKLDRMDNKLDNIQEQLEKLSNTINQNTAWMGEKMENVVELNSVKEDYRNLISYLDDFVSDIKAIEQNSTLNNTQKIMRLAQLKKEENYRAVNRLCNKIRRYMDGSNSASFPCMYDALYKSKSFHCMTANEAYEEAYPVAQALTEQYVYSVLLLAECQRAADAVCRFTDADVKQLGNGKEKRYFDDFDQYRVTLDKDVPSTQLAAAADGLKKFTAHKDGTMIFNGNKAFYPYCSNEFNVKLYPGRESKIGNYTGKTALSCDEIKTLASYVRSHYPGTSIYDFLKKWNPGALNGCSYSKRTTYLLTSNDARTNEEYDDWHGMGVCGGSKSYNCNVYARGIDIYDPACEEKEFRIYSYTRLDYYAVGIHCDTGYTDCTNYFADLFYLGKRG